MINTYKERSQKLSKEYDLDEQIIQQLQKHGITKSIFIESEEDKRNVLEALMSPLVKSVHLTDDALDINMETAETVLDYEQFKIEMMPHLADHIMVFKKLNSDLTEEEIDQFADDLLKEEYVNYIIEQSNK